MLLYTLNKGFIMKYLITLAVFFIACEKNPVNEPFITYEAINYTTKRVYKILNDTLLSLDTIPNSWINNPSGVGDHWDKDLWLTDEHLKYQYLPIYTSYNHFTESEHCKIIGFSKTKFNYLGNIYSYNISGNSCTLYRTESDAAELTFNELNLKITGDTLFVPILLCVNNSNETHYINADISIDNFLNKASVFYTDYFNGLIDYDDYKNKPINDTIDISYFDIKFYIEDFQTNN